MKCPFGTEYRIKNRGVPGCYAPMEPKVDAHCNQEFVKMFAAEQDCIRIPDQGACLYVTASAMAVGSGLGAVLLNSVEQLNPNREFLRRYKTVYEEVQKINSQMLRFNEAIQAAEAEAERKMKQMKSLANVHFQQTLTKLSGEEILKILSNPKDAELREIVKRHWSDGGSNSSILVQIASKRKDIVKKEFGESKLKTFETLVADYSSEAELARNKIDPSYRDDIERLEEKQKPYKVWDDEYLKLSKEIKVRNKLNIERTKAISEKMAAEFELKLSQIHPDLVLIRALMPSFNLVEFNRKGIPLMERPNEEQKVKTAAARESIKNSVLGGTGGAVLGLATMGGLGILAQKQVDHCADELRLSPLEVQIVKSNAVDFRLAGCRQIRLSDAKNAMLEAIDKIGFVPHGICQMLIREQKAHANFLDSEVTVKSCQTLRGRGFSSDSGSNRNIFSCTDPSNQVFNFEIGPDGLPLFTAESTKSISKMDGKERTDITKSDTFISSLARTGTRIDRLRTFTDAVYARTDTKVPIKPVDYEVCYQKAILNQTIKSVLLHSGACGPNTQAVSTEAPRENLQIR